MKILMVSDFYPPHLGGTERAVADLSAVLSARGHDVSVATLWSQGQVHRESDGHVVVHRLQSATQHLPFLFKQSSRPYHPPVADLLVAQQLQRLISAERPDIIHGHSWMFLSALQTRARSTVSTVATLHDYAVLCPKKTLLYHEQHPCQYQLSTHCLRCAPQMYGWPKALLTVGSLAAGRLAYNGVDACVAISSYVAEVHLERGQIPVERLVTIPNFVSNIVSTAPIGPRLPQLPEEYMLFVGSLGHHKGLDVLLEAYKQLHSALPLVLIGSPQPETPRSFPPGVLMIPGLPHTEIIRAMDHARFLISPARWPEPFGLVAIEAMARGRAVIASRAGGMLDIVSDGETGLLVAPGAVDQLADAMQRLADDPALAARMGLAGAFRSRTTFSEAVVVDQVIKLYATLIERRGHNR